MRAITALFCATLLACCPGVMANDIYKWTDNQGQIHYGSQPPQGYPAEKVSIRTVRMPEVRTGQHTAADADDGTAADQKSIDADVRRQVAREQAELQKYCLSMRTRLSQLKNNPRLLAEIDGQMVRLSEEQRQQRIRETEDNINEHCSNL